MVQSSFCMISIFSLVFYIYPHKVSNSNLSTIPYLMCYNVIPLRPDTRRQLKMLTEPVLLPFEASPRSTMEFHVPIQYP